MKDSIRNIQVQWFVKIAELFLNVRKEVIMIKRLIKKVFNSNYLTPSCMIPII